MYRWLWCLLYFYLYSESRTDGGTPTPHSNEPSPPRSLSVIKRNLTSRSATIDWQAPVSSNGCNSYVINYRLGSYTAANFAADANMTTTASPPCTLSGLQPFTFYTVWVQAVNAEGSSTLTSEPSNLITFKTLSDAPSQPEQLRDQNPESTSVLLRWRRPLHLNGVIAKYNIMLAKGRSVNPHSNKSLAVPITVEGNLINTTMTNLTELTWYSVWIVAVNVRETDGEQLTSPPSNVKEFGTTGGPRTTPRTVRSNVSDVSAIIKWESPLNVLGSVDWYRVSFYNVTSSNPRKQIDYEYISGKDDKLMILYYLRPSTRYRIKIKAQTDEKLWTSAAFHYFTTTETGELPQPCRTPTVTKTTSSSVHLSLSCPIDDGSRLRDCRIKRYSIKFRRHNSGNRFWEKKSVSPLSQLVDLIPFTFYEIRLIAVYNAVYCNLIVVPSPSLVIKTDPVAPPPPRNVRVRTKNAKDVVIEWNLPRYVNGTVDRCRVGYRTGTGNRTYKATSSTSISLSSLKPDTTYTYIVQALVVHTNSTLQLWSKEGSERSFTTRQAKPSSPRNLTVIKNTLTSVSVTVNWQIPVFPNGRNFYVISYGIASDTTASFPATTRQNEAGTAPSYTLSDLQPFTSYTVWVQAVNREGSKRLTSDQSNLIKFRTLTDAPSQPLHLRYANTQSTSVGLRWRPPRHLNGVVAKYNIMLAEGRSVNSSTHSNKSLAVPMTVNGNTRIATVTNLTELTWYSVWIVAVNVQETGSKQLTSPPSNVKVFGTPGGPRSAPRTVRSNVSDVSAVIMWETPLNLSRPVKWYRISYYNATSNPSEEIDFTYIRGNKKRSVNFHYLQPVTMYRTKIMGDVGRQLWTSSVFHFFTTKQGKEASSQLCETPNVTKSSTSVGLSLNCPFGNASHLGDCRIKRYSINYRLHNSGNRFIKKETELASFQLDHLFPFTTYEIRLTAVYDPPYCNIIVVPSPPLSIKTDPVAPTAPRNVRETNRNARDVSIEWNVPEYLNGTIDRYRVGKINQSYIPSTSDSTSINLTDLKPFTSYTYTVQALVTHNDRKLHLWGSKSLERSFTTLQAKPSPPRNLRVIQSDLTSVSVTVVWRAPASPNGRNSYVIKYRVGSCTSAIFLANNSRNQRSLPLSYTLSGLQPFTFYTVWVQAINKEGSSTLESEPSNQETFKTLTDAPSQPQQLRYGYDNRQSPSVRLLWHPPLHFNGVIAKYNIMIAQGRSVNSHTLSDTLVTVNGNVTNTTATGLTQFTWYSAWIVATNVRETDGEELTGPPSDVKVFVTQGGPLTAPRAVNSSVSNVSAVITWETPLNLPRPIISYRVAYFNVSSNPRKQIYYEYVSAEKPKSVIFHNLRPYTNYRTEIKGFVGPDLFTGSVSYSFTTKQSVPSRPVNLRFTRVLPRSVWIWWDRPEHPNGNLQFYTVFLLEKRNTDRSLNGREPKTTWKVTRTNRTKNISTPVEIDRLSPYTQYRITVNAANVMDGVELVGENSQWIEFKTEDEQPAAPSSCAVGQRNATFVFVTWQQPSPFDYQVAYYNVTYTSERETKTYSMKVYDERVQISLLPFTEYNITITAFTNNTQLLRGRPCSLKTPTTIGKHSTSSSSSSSRIYLIPVTLILLLLLIMVVAVLVIRIRGKRVKSKSISEENDCGLQSKDTPLQNLSAQNHDDIGMLPDYAIFVKDSRGKKDGLIAEFEQRVEHLKANDHEGFIAEFEQLAEVGSTQTPVFAVKRDNAKKNRYQNIVPYDGHCLMLGEVDGMDILETEYINATYIDSLSRDNEYIVTQGPLPNTYADFWRMVWMEKAETIVMLTRTVENDRKKCYQYWSDDEPKLCEGLTVEVVFLTKMADYTVRTMKLKLLDEVRTVTHYHFRSWPDHGVPMHATDLLGLIYHVRRDTTSSTVSPLVVHCSAGAGRSGAYTTIDSLLHCFNTGQKIVVQSIVKQMRLRRTEMVQSVKQYILIHDALLEAYYTSKTEIPVSDLSSRLSSLREPCYDASGSKKIGQEFSILMKLSPPPEASSSEPGLLSELWTRKKRDSSFIPSDLFRVTINTDDDSPDAQYANTTQAVDDIDASFINGYHKRCLFIVSQTSLSNASMWKLVYDQDAKAIVNLAQAHEHQQYWPKSGSQSYGHLKVDLLSSDNRKTYTVYKLQVSKMESVSNVSLFHFTSWPNDTPPYDICELMEMTRQLKQWMADSNGRRMIVHCCPGMERTGVFCAVYNILDQMKCEGIVNVLHVAKLLRNQRPGIIQTPEQYEAIYDIVDRCQESDVIYANC